MRLPTSKFGNTLHPGTLCVNAGGRGLDLLLRLSDAGARKMTTGKITCGVKKGVRVRGCKHSLGVSFRFGVFAKKRLPAMEGYSFLLLYPLDANAPSITFP